MRAGQVCPGKELQYASGGGSVRQDVTGSAIRPSCRQRLDCCHLKDVYAEQEAKDVSTALKGHGLIAKDSMVTIGNTYVRKVCCE
jgi:hypothetical protein